MRNRTFVALTLATLAWSSSTYGFECSLNADGGVATVVKPSGETIRLGVDRQRACQGIRVSSGNVRIVYAGREGVQERVLQSGEVINPEELRPAANSAFAAALRQLGLVLAGDNRQRAGMMRSTALRPEDYAEILPHGPVLWESGDMLIALPQTTSALTRLHLSGPGGQKVPLQKTEHGYLVRRADLSEGAAYAWRAMVNDKALEGSFALSTAEEAARVVREVSPNAGRGSPAPWSKTLDEATGLAERGYVWNAGVLIRGAL